MINMINIDNYSSWLVVYLPLWKILVSWDDSSQYMDKLKKCSEPPTIQWETEFCNVGFRKPLERPGSASHPDHSFQLCFVLGLLLLEYQDSTGLDSSWKAQPCFHDLRAVCSSSLGCVQQSRSPNTSRTIIKHPPRENLKCSITKRKPINLEAF